MKRNAIVGPNPIHPNYLTAEERINELGRILAQGLLRLHDAAKSNSQTVSTGASTPPNTRARKRRA